MLLQELTGIKSKESQTIADVLNDLYAQNKLNTKYGSFSFVIIPKDKDYVYKVWTHDAGWEKFLEYAQKNQDNPHVPKLFGKTRTIPFTFKRPKSVDENLKVQRIEKLKPLDGVLERQIGHIIKLLNSVNIDKLEASDAKELNDRLKKKNPHYSSSLPNEFVEAIIDVLKNRKDLTNDLHTENIMQREDGTPVITDPYFAKNQMTSIVTATDLLRNDFQRRHDTTDTKSGR